MKRERSLVDEDEDGTADEPQSSSKVLSCLKDFDRAINAATSSLQNGNLIALPTDTIYGLCGLAQSSSAVSRIYQVKERDLSKPIAICVANVSDVHRWAHVSVPEELLADLLPGPVTLVFERKPVLNPELNPGTILIGVRIPDDSFIRRLTTECGEPLALTSANKSGGKSPLSITEFFELWPSLDLIVDGGRLGQSGNLQDNRLGSTVVDLSVPGFYRLIRDGSAVKGTVDILRKHGLKLEDHC
ncbi:YrdC domain-containing protein, mitochondrial [Hypsibius exemplaris]|uniref:Threonylcarbamoyl-AMP synthase n=1 Tax=Hypsibius exemplaris TaxID=2072580 RepID=A0A1W0WD70_HYPEX|nr:YrdC domain-containing protein, mitochondrial [Hypsibius exemplaris]